ncbi:SPFH domain-containing protein [Xanthomonas phage X1]|nr:SPFH domain-containing protein [Xanthomonas phage X1]
MFILIGAGIAALVAVAAIFWVLNLRVVVPANEVHTLQRSKSQTSYGKDQDGGNTYYNWPSWIPLLGLTRIILPVSVFDLSLSAYEAYDKERVPFVVDVTSFFRIADSNVAAQRVSSFDELKEQLTSVVQGAVRTILASHEIDTIMVDRATFGDQFTKEVGEQLKNWGVEPVKNIELMDIRDAKGSSVIANIMAKRTSAIERDSRVAVAENTQQAKTAEIAAAQTVQLRDQEAQQAIGQRTAEKEKAVGIAKESSQQEVLTAQRETTVRQMEVKEVEATRSSEIQRKVAVVKANEVKDVAIVQAEGERQQEVINAEAQKQRTTLVAEGNLAAQKLNAEGIQAEGTAKAEAEKAMQLAPVQAQITLAKEIGENQGYQKYLIDLRQVEASEKIGVEGAKALQGAEIKVISNAGNPNEGVTNVLDMFGPKGGTKIAGMLEGLAQSDVGKQVLDRLTSK